MIVLGVIIIFILIIIVHCTVAFRRAKRSLAKAIHQQQQQSPPQPQLQTHHLSHLQQNLQIQQVMDFTTGASSSTPKFVAAVADLSNRSTHSPPSLSPQISVILVKEEDSSHHHMNLSRHWASDWSGMDRGFDESTDSLHSPTSHDNSSSPSQSTIRRKLLNHN